MQQGLKSVYHNIAKRYELANHLLTFGLDSLWRKRAVKTAVSNLPDGRLNGDLRVLDMCSGTGETASMLVEASPDGTQIFAADYSPEMLEVAQSKKNALRIEFTRADANLLPFPDSFFDVVTITFALRNLHPTKEAFLECLGELFRVLKNGGALVTLETSQPKNSFVRKLFQIYVKALVYPLGRFATANAAGFKYLSSSILKFYPAEELKTALLSAGFSEVRFKRMTFGAVALHVSKK